MRFLDRKTLHEGLWRHLVASRFAWDEGSESVYEHVAAEGFSVNVVAYHEGQLILVRQPRPVVGDPASLEVVAGAAEPGESGEEAAQRELREETGMRARRLRCLRDDLYAEPTLLDCRAELWLADQLTEDPLAPDDGERIEVVRWPLEDFDGALAQIREPLSLLALLLARPLMS